MEKRSAPRARAGTLEVPVRRGRAAHARRDRARGRNDRAAHGRRRAGAVRRSGHARRRGGARNGCGVPPPSCRRPYGEEVDHRLRDCTSCPRRRQHRASRRTGHRRSRCRAGGRRSSCLQEHDWRWSALPPRNRREEEESRLDEQDFAWWTKQLGHEPRRSGHEATAPPAPAEHSSIPASDTPEPTSRVTGSRGGQDETELSDALLKAAEVAAEQEREGADAADEGLRPERTATVRSPSPAVTDALSELDAVTHAWTQAPEPRSLPWRDPVDEPVRVGSAAKFIHALHALMYSPRHPYTTVRRAAGYTVLCLCGVAIGWLVAVLL
jgi:hypothetical protein